MFNPAAFVSAAVKGVAAVGKGLGKGQKMVAAWNVDADGDNIPERIEARDAALKMWEKFKSETLPSVKNQFGFWKGHLIEYKDLFLKEVLPPVKAVFEAERKAALED